MCHVRLESIPTCPGSSLKSTGGGDEPSLLLGAVGSALAAVEENELDDVVEGLKLGFSILIAISISRGRTPMSRRKASLSRPAASRSVEFRFHFQLQSLEGAPFLTYIIWRVRAAEAKQSHSAPRSTVSHRARCYWAFFVSPTPYFIFTPTSPVLYE